MTYGFIIAAGKQSRFESTTPKALMPYGNSTLLDVNVENMLTACDKVFIVTSQENTNFFSGDYDKLVIESGWGCGDAVLRALSLIDINEEDTVFIQWGDSLHNKYIYQYLKNEYIKNPMWLVPCVEEAKPYVQIIPCEESKIQVNFSKYDELITSGYHDLSLFYGNAKEMYSHLSHFAESIKSTGTHLYQHKHGNEMQFLDVFNETSIRGRVVVCKDYKIFAFNTMEEFNVLINS